MPDIKKHISPTQFKVLWMAIEFQEDLTLQQELNNAIITEDEVKRKLNLSNQESRTIFFDLSQKNLARIDPDGNVCLTKAGNELAYAYNSLTIAENEERAKLQALYDKMYEGKQYKIRDYEEEGVEDFSYIHVMAMTAENLSSKGAIAAELGYRDFIIHNQKAIIEALAIKIQAYADHSLEDEFTDQGSDRRNAENGAYVGRTMLANALDNILKEMQPQIEPTPTFDELKDGV